MAGLACGTAVVTNVGDLSEGLWRNRGVALASRPDPIELTNVCLRLLCDLELRRKIAADGAELYSELFAVEHSIKQLRLL